MKKQYADIRELLKACLMQEEYEDTVPVIEQMAHVRSNGYFTYDEFLTMCKWKEPRQRKRHYWQQNTEAEVRELSAKSLSAPDEARRILYLCRLKGVGIPVASALLTLINPQDYGVIDIRVWQLLVLYDEVDYDREGTAIDTLHWLECLDMLRMWADELNVSVRAVERTLYQHHRDINDDPLYS